MCVYSAISDGVGRIPLDNWTWQYYHDLEKTLESVKRLDKDLKQPDCDDPEKTKSIKRIQKHLLFRDVTNAERAVQTKQQELTAAHGAYHVTPSVDTAWAPNLCANELSVACKDLHIHVAKLAEVE